MTDENIAELPAKAPFGATLASGKKGAGKTLFGLNSPWKPVHTIDTELSSKEYFLHQKRLIELGILNGPFTRAECLDFTSFQKELYRITGRNPQKPAEVTGPGEHYGTILIDTAGQWSEWVSNYHHSQVTSEKLGQIVWGRIRDQLRRALIELSGHCDCLLLTAHERKYEGVVSPRCNPALLEIVAIHIRLQRDPNKRLPSAEIPASRVPFFPPRINDFVVAKLIPYFGDPADWTQLPEEQLIQPEPVFTPPPEESENE